VTCAISGAAYEEYVAIDRYPPPRLRTFCQMASLLNSAYDSLSSAFRRGLIKVLAAGPVPQHIAFVMDGNRRYARQRNVAINQGHTDGFNALRQVCSSHVSFRSLLIIILYDDADVGNMFATRSEVRHSVCLLD